MASSLEKILASAGKANTNKQAQVVVNSGAGRVDLPAGTDASKLTGQDVQQIVKTSPVKQVITPEQTAQATKQNGNTVYLPTGTAVPLSQRAKTVNLPQGNAQQTTSAERQKQMLDGMMRGGQQSGGRFVLAPVPTVRNFRFFAIAVEAAVKKLTRHHHKTDGHDKHDIARIVMVESGCKLRISTGCDYADGHDARHVSGDGERDGACKKQSTPEPCGLIEICVASGKRHKRKQRTQP
jgi:hypothetical protein